MDAPSAKPLAAHTGAQGRSVGRAPSMRGRLALALLAVSLAWAVVVTASVGMAVHRGVDAVLDTALQESAEVLLGVLRLQRAHLPLGQGGAMPAPDHDERLVWQIVDGRDRRVLLRSHEAPDSPLVADLSPGLASIGTAWRVCVLPFDGQGRQLLVAQRHADRHDARLVVQLWSMLAACAVGLASAWWLRARLAAEFGQLTQLSQAVRTFDPLRVHAPLPAATRGELQPLRDAVSSLGTRLAQRVDAERAFAAHAAHALRTPLATMAANLAAAQQRASPGEQAPLQRARAAADRLQRVVTSLLALFRSGGEVRRERVVLDDLAAQLPLDTLELQFDPGAALHADPDLLAAALVNLLDNAVRHGARSVQLQVLQQAGEQVLAVIDDGRGADAATRTALQSAIDRQTYDGPTGLGLMLVDKVARAHGGSLRLLDTTAGFGVALSVGTGQERAA